MGALCVIVIPFVGTIMGSACVFFMRGTISNAVTRALSGFAAGIMVAAAVWSLLIPAMEQSVNLGKWSFLPAAVGFSLGVLFLMLLDHLIPHLHSGSQQAEGPKCSLKKTTMLMLAVTLHNIPEGMAVGAVFAGTMDKECGITFMSAFALALGIAIQNFPEGAIISMPLKSEGVSKNKAFIRGVLSGAVEPIGTIMTIVAANFVISALPYFLGFAAGAMMYVVIEELIPEMSQGKHSDIANLLFGMGFVLMMVLDVVLG